ncbi:MAG: hypothetical protein RL071_3328 [Pseudomonadota bacterium]
MHPTLFIELRCEELPARFVRLAEAGLRDAVLQLLSGVAHGAVRTWATPRRVALAIEDLAPARPEELSVVTGPAEAASYRDGKPTPAAIGFAKGKGVPVEELILVDSPKGRVIAAQVRSGGQRVVDLLAQGLGDAILGIPFVHTMTWGPARWARPIHGLVALYGADLVPATVAGIAAGRETLGHRLRPGPITIAGAETYADLLAAHFVIADRAAREAAIRAQLDATAAGLGLKVGELDLIDEVVDLVEWPQVVACAFDQSLLHLPPRLLVESMGVHQRVFPLFDGDTLSHRFLAVSNHPFADTDPDCAATIAAGNAKVLGARFHDARFFYAEDRKKTLAVHGEKLARMQWIRGGGTMADKGARVGAIAEDLAPRLGATGASAARAGGLSKADLATQMVGEFPELQGHVGRLLAAFDGETAEISLAIEEHYLPRFSGDQLPTSTLGLSVALADRLDTLTRTFALGLKPKGSADPLGLRRAAGGLVTLLLHAGLRVELPGMLRGADGAGASASAGLGGAPVSPLSDEQLAELVGFVMDRARAALTEPHATDVVNAVFASRDHDVVALAARCAAMSALAADPAFDALKTTFKRVMNITKDHATTAYAPGALIEPAEVALVAAFDGARETARACAEASDYAGALRALTALRGPVDHFFEAVLVMAPEPELRDARLGLLSAIALEFRRIADFKHLN